MAAIVAATPGLVRPCLGSGMTSILPGCMQPASPSAAGRPGRINTGLRGSPHFKSYASAGRTRHVGWAHAFDGTVLQNFVADAYGKAVHKCKNEIYATRYEGEQCLYH